MVDVRSTVGAALLACNVILFDHENLPNIRLREGGQRLLSGLDNFIDESLLPLLKLVHLVFDSPLGDEPDDLHDILLSDPVRPVCSLLLYGGIPP
ncbi:hypothetical protein D3C84_1045060 [compost metagenome]